MRINVKTRLDCRLYLGDRPCRWERRCDGCEHYSPMGMRIAIIKLAAAGDVLRTTAVLAPLKRKYPESHVTWVTDEEALPLLSTNPAIDRAMPCSPETWLVLGSEHFDTAICLDKEPRAAALLGMLDAEKRLGFGLSAWGTVEALNEGALYDLSLGLDNDLKFNVNRKSYSEIACGIAEVPYEADPHILVLPESSRGHARDFLASAGLDGMEPLVGLNVGAGDVFANKAWTVEGFASLARMVVERLGGKCILLGGPGERARVTEVLRISGDAAVDGKVHGLLDFAALVGSLNALVTGDTLAMHIAIALEVPVVAVFGPTVAHEVCFHGRGEKIISTIDCAPCYRRACDKSPNCMDLVDEVDVFGALEEVLRLR